MDLVLDHSKQIVDAFEKVMEALNLLCHHIQFELKDFPVWAQNPDKTFSYNRNKVIYAIRKHELDFSIGPTETFTCAGAVAGTDKTYTLIQCVNLAKSNFKEAVSNYHQSEVYHYTIPARKFLSRAGYIGIKLKQVYRHIVMLDYQPRKIAWTEGKDSSNKTITIQEAETKLLKMGVGEHIDIQLNKLKSLGPNEKLVIRRDIKPHSMANVSRLLSDNKTIITDKVKTSLPIFFLFDANLPAPEVCFSEARPRKTLNRADRKLELEPFLPSLAAFRYMTQ